MRTWRLLFAVGLLAALLVPANGASAKPHETVGEIHTSCEVHGSVDLAPGVNLERSPGSYDFEDTSLTCRGEKEGVYQVFADGNTTDLWHGKDKKDPTNPENGEDCLQGGSEQVGDELHTGNLDAFQGDTQVFDGNVHFARLGEIVLADGPLEQLAPTDKAGTQHFFQAELLFQPTEGSCTTAVTAASLDGTAEIYYVNSPNDVRFEHDCTQDEKTGDPHCTLP